jgi:uncharacterized protein (TIGR01777 family)
MRIVIIGGTGFIGRKLIASLHQEEYDLTVVTRNADKARENIGDHAEFCLWDGENEEILDRIFSDAYAVINLSGESIAGKRWSVNQMQKIIESRVNSVKAVVRAINRAEDKPAVLIQASAIGYYGSDNKFEKTEKSGKGKGFLSDVTQKWEEATRELYQSVRLVLLRTGVVIGTGGGALKAMEKPFRFGFGGHFGLGRQWLSWIHIDDTAKAIQFLLENKDAEGIYNLTAPNPEKMKDFAKELGRALKRRSWFHIPSPLIRLAMGQMGEEMVLASQKVLPMRLMEEGYSFQFTDIRSALTSIYNS